MSHGPSVLVLILVRVVQALAHYFLTSPSYVCVCVCLFYVRAEARDLVTCPRSP
jgi:hypothetical protein